MGDGALIGLTQILGGGAAALFAGAVALSFAPAAIKGPVFSLALRYWWAIAIAGLIALLALQTGRLDSAKASLHTSKAETARERANSRAWEASFRQSEGMRLKDQDAASVALSEADRQCDARVSAARKSSHAIQTIIQKVPTYDQAGCPVRERVPSGLLNDAIKPAG